MAALVADAWGASFLVCATPTAAPPNAPAASRNVKNVKNRVFILQQPDFSIVRFRFRFQTEPSSDAKHLHIIHPGNPAAFRPCWILQKSPKGASKTRLNLLSRNDNIPGRVLTGSRGHADGR